MLSGSFPVFPSLTRGWRMTTWLHQEHGMTDFLAQLSQESQVGYLRFRFPNIRFKLFILGFVLLYIFLQWTLSFWLCLVLLCLTDKNHVSPRLSLTNVAALNYLLRSRIFVNGDGQLRVVHLILDYEPLSNIFQEVGNAIRANDYRLAHIDVSRPHFLAPYNLPLVDHLILQGVPLATQPIQ